MPHVTGVAGRSAPAELVLVGVAGPQPDVERFEDVDVVDVPARVGGDQRGVLREARVDAAAEDG